MLDMHWSNMRLPERWTWERYVRLCKFLNYTPYELASFALIRHDCIEKYQRTNRFPAINGNAAALVLTLIEAYVMARWTNDVIEKPFPKLPDASSHHNFADDKTGVCGVSGTVGGAETGDDDKLAKSVFEA